jgi:hypothetical protein
MKKGVRQRWKLLKIREDGLVNIVEGLLDASHLGSDPPEVE